MTESREGSDQVGARQWDLLSDQPRMTSDQLRRVATAAHGSPSRRTSVRHSCRSAGPASVTTYGWSGWFGSSGRVIRISPARSRGIQALTPRERTVREPGLAHEVGLLSRHFVPRDGRAPIVGQVGQCGSDQVGVRTAGLVTDQAHGSPLDLVTCRLTKLCSVEATLDVLGKAVPACVSRRLQESLHGKRVQHLPNLRPRIALHCLRVRERCAAPAAGEGEESSTGVAARTAMSAASSLRSSSNSSTTSSRLWLDMASRGWPTPHPASVSSSWEQTKSRKSMVMAPNSVRATLKRPAIRRAAVATSWVTERVEQVAALGHGRADGHHVRWLHAGAARTVQ